MTTEEIKAKLSVYVAAGQRLDHLLEKREELYSKAIYSSPKYTETVKHKGRPDKIAAALAKVDIIDRQIAETVNTYCQSLKQVQDIIKALGEDYDARLVLEYRYINGWKWVDIAKQLHFALSYVYRLHGIGLEKLASMAEGEKDDKKQ